MTLSLLQILIPHLPIAYAWYYTKIYTESNKYLIRDLPDAKLTPEEEDA
jgi:hypothetical protein